MNFLQAFIHHRTSELREGLCETAMLEECLSDRGHEHMTMEALPGASLEVIKPEFLFQLLMSLFANPSGFDRGS